MADAKKTEASETEAAPSKKKGKLLLFIIIGVVAVVLIGGGALFFMMKKKASAESEDGEEVATKDEKPKKKKEKNDHAAAPSFYKFDKPFTVKLQTEQQEAYLQAEVQLRVLDAATLERLKQFEPEIKHKVTLILLSKKASDLVQAAGVQKLSNEIRDTVNNVLEPPARPRGKKVAEEAPPAADQADSDAPVQSVLFTSFIVQ